MAGGQLCLPPWNVQFPFPHLPTHTRLPNSSGGDDDRLVEAGRSIPSSPLSLNSTHLPHLNIGKFHPFQTCHLLLGSLFSSHDRDSCTLSQSTFSFSSLGQLAGVGQRSGKCLSSHATLFLYMEVGGGGGWWWWAGRVMEGRWSSLPDNLEEPWQEISHAPTSLPLSLTCHFAHLHPSSFACLLFSLLPLSLSPLYMPFCFLFLFVTAKKHSASLCLPPLTCIMHWLRLMQPHWVGGWGMAFFSPYLT